MVWFDLFRFKNGKTVHHISPIFSKTFTMVIREFSRKFPYHMRIAKGFNIIIFKFSLMITSYKVMIKFFFFILNLFAKL